MFRHQNTRQSQRKMCDKFCDDVAQVGYMGIKLANINAFT